MDYDTFANTRLRDVPYEVFEAYKDRLPELWRRRAEHYYSEFARAEKGAELWRKGDLEGYGQLVFESGKSSIYSYECGCDELKKLYLDFSSKVSSANAIVNIFPENTKV